jgi:AAA15 family ATPase/GTPase
MLVEFSVANFRSIHARQTLSLVAGAGDELRDTHVMASGAPATPDLLRSAVIYGPNAAGKSNLILALQFILKLVVNSAQKSQQGDEIEVSPFLMDGGEAAAKPSEFELIFVEQGIRYQYGVALTRQRVESEWLIAYPNGSPQTWFERAAGGERSWKFGPSFKGQRKLWQKSTRDNALFLSTAIQLDSKQLMPVFRWFHDRLCASVSYNKLPPIFTIKKCEQDGQIRDQIVDFLKSADLGIERIQINHRKMKQNKVQFSEKMLESERQKILKDLETREFIETHLVHKTPDGQEVSLGLNEESGGTQQLFNLAGPLLDVLHNGLVLVIDELDTHLHPLLMRRLVDLFHDPVINRSNAQLIFSTHDTTILDREVFRRDQVWFVEKDRQQQTRLYSLKDFSPRKDENFGRGYLQGRYVALPFIGEWKI